MSHRRSSFSSARFAYRPFTLSRSCKEDSSEPESCVFSGRRVEFEGKSGFHDAEELRREDSGVWGAWMPPELLGEIIRRVEVSEDKWPQRQNVVACGCVCRQWREATREVVERALVGHPGTITLPSSLKKPGPRDAMVQCLIKRDKKTGSFRLYLELTLSFTDKGKFLLAAQRYRNSSHTEYVISLDADDASQGTTAYVGKLRSDFLGTSFIIYDTQPPHDGAKPTRSKSGRRVGNKQISPQIPDGNYDVGMVSYKFNFLKSRGPRRMVCSLKSPSSSGAVPLADASNTKNPSESASHSYTVLKNKAPRWHDHLECWCLNFHGRVTVASVKNFQLVEGGDQSQPGARDTDEPVLLQFGKVSDDTFTMDYRYPLSAFRAFAICLTSFGTKLACE